MCIWAWNLWGSGRCKIIFKGDVPLITLGECAMLIGILQPVLDSHQLHPERAHYKRNVVLRVMRDEKFINKDMFLEARAIERENVIYRQAKGLAPYFTEYVRRTMEKEDDQLGVNIYRDGLKIHY